jgi:hypothetical protein
MSEKTRQPYEPAPDEEKEKLRRQLEDANKEIAGLKKTSKKSEVESHDEYIVSNSEIDKLYEKMQKRASFKINRFGQTICPICKVAIIDHSPQTGHPSKPYADRCDIELEGWSNKQCELYTDVRGNKVEYGICCKTTKEKIFHESIDDYIAGKYFFKKGEFTLPKNICDRLGLAYTPSLKERIAKMIR